MGSGRKEAGGVGEVPGSRGAPSRLRAVRESWRSSGAGSELEEEGSISLRAGGWKGRVRQRGAPPPEADRSTIGRTMVSVGATISLPDDVQLLFVILMHDS
jgi:hypothetical protein